MLSKKIAGVNNRVVLIGQAPGGVGDPRIVLGGRVGRRMAALAGCTLERFLEATQRWNLIEHFPGRLAGGDAFPILEARRGARMILWRLHGRVVVMVGIGVARCFGVRGEPATWRLRQIGFPDPLAADPRFVVEATVAVLPHPSGRDRWYNDPGNRERAARLLSDVIAGANRVRSSLEERARS